MGETSAKKSNNTKLDRYMERDYRGTPTVTLVLTSPAPSTRQMIHNQLVGHTFIRLDYGDGRVLYRGFHGTRMTLTQILKKSDVAGEIKDDSSFEWDVAKTYEITTENADKIKEFIDNYQRGYNIVSNNCTTFAIEALHTGGVSVPTSKHHWRLYKGFLGFLFKSLTGLFGFYGYTPADAVEDIKLTHDYYM